MTFIAKPVIEESEILNHVARDMLVELDGEVKLKRRLRVATEEGVIHELSFAQVDGLLNILDTTREVPSVTPLQYLVQAYNLEDLVTLGKDNWMVTAYTVIVLAEAKVVRFEGRLTRAGSVDKEFTFALGGFDFIQQLSLARCIGGLDERFKQVIGTYDLNYTFESGPEGVKVFTGAGI